MKTIKVSDEMYAFLIDLSKKMNTQDNRATADPYMYTITEIVERPAAEGCGESKLIDDEGNEWDLDIVREEFPNEIKHYAKMMTDNLKMTDDIVKDYLIHSKLARKIYFTIEREALHKMRMNVFFTEDAIRLHLKQNSYHFDEGKDYMIHAWRNPEMEMVHKFLKGLIKR